MKKGKQYISGRFAFKTDIGKVRITNEDQALALINARGNVLLLVCDGMGGEKKGDLASDLTKRIVQEMFEKKSFFFNRADAILWIKKTVRQANKAVYSEASKNPSYHGMGTTLTLALIVNDLLVLAQVGDSRAYSVSQRKVTQISEDQTYVAYLFRTGQITKEEMRTHPKRHVLMNAIGTYATLDVDVKAFQYNNENLLLCSDGLYNNLSDTDICSVLVGRDSTDLKVNELISLANSNGGSDNIAVVLWEASK